MRKIVVLEDDEIMRRNLCRIIDELHQSVEVLCAANMKEAYHIAMEQQIHLFLVDIILEPSNPGDISGLRFVQEIRGVKRYEFIPVIFITSLQDPRMYSYSQLNCLGFIEKPFDEKSVEKLILKALDFPIIHDNDRYIYFRKDGITYSICINEIYYIEICRRNLTVHCKNGKLEVPYKTCKEILKELGSLSFIQCSRYAIINKRCIEHIDYASRFVKLKNVKQLIEIGPMMKNRFKDEMTNDGICNG